EGQDDPEQGVVGGGAGGGEDFHDAFEGDVGVGEGGEVGFAGAVDQGEYCPLNLIALTERTPAEWTGTHGRYSCSEKVTPAQQRAADREARRAAEAAERAAIEAQHYPLFDLGEVGP
ncbi:hypothetical protein, partial [Nocardia gipuzkoensis]|uniref:hypothetical protein n=1 Tax=Nocardia gipuzkoensis TaxID=2749991 RepID=UPI00245869C3